MMDTAHVTSAATRFDSARYAFWRFPSFDFGLFYFVLSSLAPPTSSPPSGEGRKRRKKKKEKNIRPGRFLPSESIPFGCFFWASRPPRAHGHRRGTRGHTRTRKHRENHVSSPNPPLPRVSLSQEHNDKTVVCCASPDGEEGFILCRLCC